MQRGTLQEAPSSSVQVEAWRRRSCQRHLHRRHQRLFSPTQAAKWRTSCRRPRQVTALGQRARFSSLPERPSAEHPSSKMWRKHSMVSCSSMNRQASVCSESRGSPPGAYVACRGALATSYCCASTTRPPRPHRSATTTAPAHTRASATRPRTRATAPAGGSRAPRRSPPPQATHTC
ncbi:unnamed protein product, partial [Musa textilis]